MKKRLFAGLCVGVLGAALAVCVAELLKTRAQLFAMREFVSAQYSAGDGFGLLADKVKFTDADFDFASDEPFGVFGNYDARRFLAALHDGSNVVVIASGIKNLEGESRRVETAEAGDARITCMAHETLFALVTPVRGSVANERFVVSRHEYLKSNGDFCCTVFHHLATEAHPRFRFSGAPVYVQDPENDTALFVTPDYWDFDDEASDERYMYLLILREAEPLASHPELRRFAYVHDAAIASNRMSLNPLDPFGTERRRAEKQRERDNRAFTEVWENVSGDFPATE